MFRSWNVYVSLVFTLSSRYCCHFSVLWQATKKRLPRRYPWANILHPSFRVLLWSYNWFLLPRHIRDHRKSTSSTVFALPSCLVHCCASRSGTCWRVSCRTWVELRVRNSTVTFLRCTGELWRACRILTVTVTLSGLMSVALKPWLRVKEIVLLWPVSLNK